MKEITINIWSTFSQHMLTNRAFKSIKDWCGEIIKNSKVELIMISGQKDLGKYIKQNVYGDKIVIGMGAGTISTWMRELPKLLS